MYMYSIYKIMLLTQMYENMFIMSYYIVLCDFEQFRSYIFGVEADLCRNVCYDSMDGPRRQHKLLQVCCWKNQLDLWTPNFETTNTVPDEGLSTLVYFGCFWRVESCSCVCKANKLESNWYCMHIKNTTSHKTKQTKAKKQKTKNTMKQKQATSPTSQDSKNSFPTRFNETEIPNLCFFKNTF